MRNGWNNKRLRALTSLFLLFFIFIIFRLFYLQIYKAPKFRAEANRQRARDIQLLAQRGSIYDSDGKELAVSVKKQTVFATPYLVADPREAARKLSKILKKDRLEILDKLTSNKGFVYIERKVSKARADKIKALKIEGIDLCDEYKRYYPSGSIASQVIGFVGLDNNGLAGIEQLFDKRLSGKFGRLVYEQDALGREIPGSTMLYNKPVKGLPVQLTIDTEIQYKAEEELKKAVELWGAKAGTAIVMNPNNGEILALANVPDFELNKFSTSPPEAMKNRAVIEVFEPGSIMKPFFAAAALEEKLYKPESMFNLPPSITVGGKSIGEAHDRPTVNYSLSDIILHSSNVGMSKIGIALQKERIVEYARKFGFGTKTGLEFPGEVTGVVPSTNRFYGPTVATVCFGQGISSTAVQMARAYASLANGGYMINPTLIKSPKKDKKPSKRRIVSQQTAWDVTLMLEKVIKEGTGKEAAVPGYVVAGKTGTAQKPEGSKGYTGKYIGTFVGYAPAENAQLLVLVSVDEPSNAIYGGVVAAPAFKAIMEYSLSHLQISPR